MSSPLALNVDFVLILLSGLFLLLLSALRSLAASDPARPWQWLAWFAGFHSLRYGLELAVLEYGGHPFLSALQSILLAGASGCLLEFARGGAPRRPGRWIFLPLLGLLTLTALLAGPTGIAWGNFALAAIAGVSTALILRHGHRPAKENEPDHSLPLAGVVLLLYQLCTAYPGTLLDPAWLNLGPEQPRLLSRGLLAAGLTALLLTHSIATEKGRWSTEQTAARKRRRLACGVAILLIGVVGWLTADFAGHHEDREMRRQILLRTQIAAAVTPAEAVGQLFGDDRDLQNPAYRKLKALLTTIRLANPDLRFVLLARLRDQQVHFLADSENPSSPDYSPPGQLYEDTTPDYLAGLASGRPFVLGPETDHWGTWIFSAAPILDAQGRPLAYLEMDVAAAEWEILLRHARLPALLIALLIATLVVSSFRAIERLRENAAFISLSEQRNRSLVEGSPDCVQMFDRAGRYLAVNQNGLRTLGRPAAEVLGRHFSELWPEAARPRIIDAVHTTLAGSPTSFEADYVNPEGRTVTWRVATNPIFDETGHVRSFVGICVDLTVRKQAELALLAAKKAAEDATQAKSDFLAVMSHEIRTPLAGIMGMLDLLRKSPLQDQPQRYARFALESAESLLELLDDALDSAKIEAGKLTLEAIAFRPRECFEAVFATAAIRAAAKGLGFHHTISPAVPAVLLGDPSRLRQVINNLVNNALKFTEHGRVTVALDSTLDPGGVVRLRIAVGDTGIGISAENIGRLFTKYNQAETSTTRHYGGTGLGLSIVKDLAALMHGEVSVTSEAGTGSTFHFSATLALGQEANIPAALLPPPAATPATLRLRVLVVDDDAANRTIATALVTAHGHHVEQATNGREAVDRLIKESFDLVLMDNRMPVMDGLTATRLIRDPATGVTDPLIYIIALTADASSDDRTRCLTSTMDDFVTKPVRTPAMASALQRAAQAVQTRRGATPTLDLASRPPGLSEAELLAALEAEAAAPAGPEPELPGALMDKITALFLQESPGRLAALHEAFRLKDAVTLGREAHTLKSNVRYFHAHQLADLAARVEALADRSQFDALAPLLAEIDSACAVLRDRLRQNQPPDFNPSLPMLQILLVDDNEIERTALREIMKAEPEWEVIEAGDGQQALDLLCDGLRPHLCIFDMNMPKLNGLELLQRMRRDLALRQLHVVVATATRDRDSVIALAKLGIDGYLLKPHTVDSTMTNLRQVIGAIPVVVAPLVATRNLLNKTALVVEDDLLERTAVCEMIKAEPGWDVVEAASGARALDLLRTSLAPDLCLVDLRMPQMDGLTVVHKIRGELALERLRIVILTGEHDRNKILQLSKLGISGYLLKPANPAKLQVILRAIAGVPAESTATTPTAPPPKPATQPVYDDPEPNDAPLPSAAPAEPAPAPTVEQ